MQSGVVFVFDPGDELTVEGFQRGKVKLAGEKMIADSSKKSFNFTFGGTVSYRCMRQETSQTGTNEGEFMSDINGAIIDVELLGDSTFVDGRA